MGEPGGAPPPPPREDQNYRVSFLKYLLRIQCPVEEYLDWASNPTNLWVHFFHCHAQETIMILKGDNRHCSKCSKSDMFVSHTTLNSWHLATAVCCMGEERKQRRLEEENS